MKILRTISIAVVMIGLFVWFLTPFVSNYTYYSSDGIPASSIVFNSDSHSTIFFVSVLKEPALRWMPMVSVVLLGVCLLFIFLNKYRVVGACSAVAIAILAIGGKQALASFNTAVLSVGYLLLMYIFIALLGISIVASIKPKNIPRASGIAFSILGGVLWFSAPFLSENMFHDIIHRQNAIASVSLLSSANAARCFPSIKGDWESTPIFWLSIVTILLLGACLLLAILNCSRWSFICAFAGIASLLGGAVLISTLLPLKTLTVHFGIGLYLLIGIFALLAYFSILEMIEVKNSKAAEKLSVSEEYV